MQAFSKILGIVHPEREMEHAYKNYIVQQVCGSGYGYALNKDQAATIALEGSNFTGYESIYGSDLLGFIGIC